MGMSPLHQMERHGEDPSRSQRQRGYNVKADLTMRPGTDAVGLLC
jgi:hypothetical protein